MRTLIFLSLFLAQPVLAAVICEDASRKQSVEFSMENLEAKVNGQSFRCRESQATSAFYCVQPGDENADEIFEAVVNLDRDRRPVSARILSVPGAVAMPCRDLK